MDLLVDHIVRITGVSNCVCPTKKHLEGNVWDKSAQFPQPVPRVFMKKSHRNIKCGAFVGTDRIKSYMHTEIYWKGRNS